jgi:hypothetical protein
MTRWALNTGIASVVSLMFLAGCNGVNARAPALTLPERPELTRIQPERWRAVDPETRVVLTENQEMIFEYVDKLERMMLAYEAWRTGGS